MQKMKLEYRRDLVNGWRTPMKWGTKSRPFQLQVCERVQHHAKTEMSSKRDNSNNSEYANQTIEDLFHRSRSTRATSG